MAGATNPGNVGHAWVKALWVDHVPPPGFDRAELYDPGDYQFIRARLDDNPIYANDKEYRRTLAALPEHLRKAFLEGDWNVFAGQYFDIFDLGRHTSRPKELKLEPWWPRWISIDWGFQHPSAVYWHCAVPAGNSVRATWARSRWGASGEVVFSGNYTTGGDTMDFATVDDKLSSSQIMQIFADSQNGNSGYYVPVSSATLSGWKLKAFTGGGTEISAGAYPASITSDIVEITITALKLQ